jgi:hypothetical protein
MLFQWHQFDGHEERAVGRNVDAAELIADRPAVHELAGVGVVHAQGAVAAGGVDERAVGADRHVIGQARGKRRGDR